MMYEQDIDIDRHIIDRNLSYYDQRKANYFGAFLGHQENPTFEFRSGSPVKLMTSSSREQFFGSPRFVENSFPHLGVIKINSEYDSKSISVFMRILRIEGSVVPTFQGDFLKTIFGIKTISSRYKKVEWIKTLEHEYSYTRWGVKHYSFKTLEKIIATPKLLEELRRWCYIADASHMVKLGSTLELIISLTGCAKRLLFHINFNLFVFFRHPDYPTLSIIWDRLFPLLCTPEKETTAEQNAYKGFVGVYELDACRYCGISQTTLYELIRVFDPDNNQVLWLSDGDHCELAEAFYKQLVYRMNNGYKSNSILMNGLSPLPPIMDRFVDIRVVAKIYQTVTGKNAEEQFPIVRWLKSMDFSLVDVTYNVRT